VRFTDEPLSEIRGVLSAALGSGPVHFDVPDPDLSAEHFDGEPIEVNGEACRYRSFSVWVGLAESLGARLGTPEPVGVGFVRLHLRPLDPARSWHRTARPAGDPEKYGADTDFARTDKFEDPAFLRAWDDALDLLDPPPNARILSLGCHTGAELAHLTHRCPSGSLVGVDHSPTAIACARARHSDERFQFVEGDLRDLPGLDLGRFDLVIAINVLHSPALPGQAIFRKLVADHLTERGGLLLGFPNCRYVDHTLVYGAAVRHARHPELSVLLNDLSYHRRYLHQHRFRTMVTGKNTILLAGKRLPPKAK
jgi:SAM-dependent methyltransferase